jgi:hypothetical protein
MITGLVAVIMGAVAIGVFALNDNTDDQVSGVASDPLVSRFASPASGVGASPQPEAASSYVFAHVGAVVVAPGAPIQYGRARLRGFAEHDRTTFAFEEAGSYEGDLGLRVPAAGRAAVTIEHPDGVSRDVAGLEWVGDVEVQLDFHGAFHRGDRLRVINRGDGPLTILHGSLAIVETG